MWEWEWARYPKHVERDVLTQALTRPGRVFSDLVYHIISYAYILFLAIVLSFFFSCIPVCSASSCPFVCAAAICYSQQVRILYCSTRSFCLCHLHRTPSRNYFVFYSFSFFFFVALISRVAFLRCALVPGTLRSTWFAYLDSLATFGFSLSHCDHRICISLGWRIRKDTGGTADVVR